MSEIIIKPSREEVDLTICIPAYRREKELVILHHSIRESLIGINYNIYFLLNGADENVKNLVLNEIPLDKNTGVINFKENIKEDIFIWPLLNLPKGHFWIIGDDDFVTANAKDVLKRSFKNDLTILNYDLFDKNLDRKLFGSFLGKYFREQAKPIDPKYLFSNLSEKLSYISSVIIDSRLISSDFEASEPKSFQFGKIIYSSIANKKNNVSIYFEDKICLKQRGNNINNDDKFITDDIFINDLRFFYLSMIKIPTYRVSAVKKFLEASFVLTPRLLIRCAIEGRYPKVKSFFVADYIFYFAIRFLIRLIPKSLFISLKGFLK